MYHHSPVEPATHRATDDLSHRAADQHSLGDDGAIVPKLDVVHEGHPHTRRSRLIHPPPGLLDLRDRQGAGGEAFGLGLDRGAHHEIALQASRVDVVGFAPGFDVYPRMPHLLGRCLRCRGTLESEHPPTLSPIA